jgi:glutathione S-transferase
MRIHATVTSPFVRKVLVTAHELGLQSQLDWTATNPHVDEYLRGDNPLCKIPTLLSEEGALFDSRVICEFLDSLHAGTKLFPASGHDRWSALRLQALGDGLSDANVSRRNELIRPANEQSPSWIARQSLAVRAALDWLEDHSKELAGPVTIGSIAVGCALGYFEVRFPEEDWRTGHAELTSWFEEFAKRPSMQSTRYSFLKSQLPAPLIKEGGVH